MVILLLTREALESEFSVVSGQGPSCRIRIYFACESMFDVDSDSFGLRELTATLSYHEHR